MSLKTKIKTYIDPDGQGKMWKQIFNRMTRLNLTQGFLTTKNDKNLKKIVTNGCPALNF
jgi:hypothetical protein